MHPPIICQRQSNEKPLKKQYFLENYRRRFESQLKGQPDPQAPLDKEGKPKHYFRFDNFIRAMIYQELKA